MGNVFKQLVRKEFGIGNYERYCGYIYEEEDHRTPENRMVFQEMYTALKDKDELVLKQKRERLDGVIFQAYMICRHYSLAVGTVIFTTLMILLLAPEAKVLSFLLFADMMAFLAKTYEYIANKYCYVDARIVLIYKAVLDKLSPEQPET